MSDDNIAQLIQPGSFSDPLTEVLRNGARSLLAKAVEAEVASFLAKHADLKTDDGRSRLVRLDGHNQLPKVVLGVRFSDGLEVETASHQPQAAA